MPLLGVAAQGLGTGTDELGETFLGAVFCPMVGLEHGAWGAIAGWTKRL
jgi:hypothetical protein